MRNRVAVFLLALGTAAWTGSLMLAQEGAHRHAGASSGFSLAKTITYCASCHNDVLRSASGLLLEKLDVARIDSSPQLWAKAYRQMQAGAMPPVGAPRPDRANAAALAEIERMMGVDATPTSAKSQKVATRLASMLWNGTPDAALGRGNRQ